MAQQTNLIEQIKADNTEYDPDGHEASARVPEMEQALIEQAAEIARLRELLCDCAGQLENFARSEFEGVWPEAVFVELLAPYNAALEGKQ